jgi:hypothetical protein
LEHGQVGESGSMGILAREPLSLVVLLGEEPFNHSPLKKKAFLKILFRI